MQAKKARDDFATLLELSPELKAGIRYSKAAVIFEDEPRWRVRVPSHHRHLILMLCSRSAAARVGQNCMHVVG